MSCHSQQKDLSNKLDEEGIKYKKIALVGNPNVGKSRIFNFLTKSNESVGNFPGVTVGVKGKLLETIDSKAMLFDLPGTYGLSDNNPAEIITKNWLLENNPDIIINIIDASNLQRNLLLTLLLLELDIPIIAVVNKIDLTKKSGVTIDYNVLKSELQLPLFALSATNKQSLSKFKDWLLAKIHQPLLVPKEPNYPSDLINYLYELQLLLPKDFRFSLYELRRFLEQDVSKLNNSLIVSNKEENLTNECCVNSEKTVLENLKPKIIDFQTKYTNYETVFIEERQQLSRKITNKCINKNTTNRSYTQMLDQVLTDKYLGIPIFLLIIWIMFQFTFELSRPFIDYLALGINAFELFTTSLLAGIPNGTLISSFIINGLFSGVGTVLSFLPIIFFLFIIIAILEESGYFARGSFIVDKLFVYFGLEGRSFVPMVLGFGCNIPGILSTRNITGKRERYLTISIIPFMSCSARLPVYILLASIFFLTSTSEIILFLYLTGVVVGLLLILIFKVILQQRNYFSTPLILEMPPYMIPSLDSILKKAYNQIKSFLKKISSTILIGTIIVWFLSHITINPISLTANSLGQKSLLYYIGTFIQPVFAPLGFDWKLIIALVFGILAKELIISTLAVLYFSNETLLAHSLTLDPTLTPLIALTYMVFILLYTPCLPTLSMIKSETSKKFTLFVILYTFVIAYVVSFAVMSIGNLLI